MVIEEERIKTEQPKDISKTIDELKKEKEDLLKAINQSGLDPDEIKIYIEYIEGVYKVDSEEAIRQDSIKKAKNRQ